MDFLVTWATYFGVSVAAIGGLVVLVVGTVAVAGSLGDYLWRRFDIDEEATYAAISVLVIALIVSGIVAYGRTHDEPKPRPPAEARP
jgi:hypothetical protein